MKTTKTVLSFIESHLNQLWLITPACARLLYSRIPALERQIEQYHRDNPDSELQQKKSEESDDFEQFLEISNGLAILHIEGVLSKHPAPSRFLRSANPPTYPEVASAMRYLQTESNVEEILLRIESPGGGFFGLKEAADAIYETRQTKNVTAFCDDRCSSAAYWLGSQANRMIANPTAQLSSIGTFAILIDTSEQNKMFGLEYILVSSGGIKGSGADGKVSQELIEDVQRQVNEAQAFFNADVARGRPALSLERVSELADGREYFAAEAMEMGLIDEIDSFTDVVMRLTPEKESRSFPQMRGKRNQVVINPTQVTTSRHYEPHSRAVIINQLPRTILKTKENHKPMPPEIKDLFIKAGAPKSATDEDVLLWALEELERQDSEIDRLRPLAKEAETARASAIETALTEGKRARGDKFDDETWKARLQKKTYEEIIEQSDEWREIADEGWIPGRRVQSEQPRAVEPTSEIEEHQIW